MIQMLEKEKCDFVQCNYIRDKNTILYHPSSFKYANIDKKLIKGEDAILDMLFGESIPRSTYIWNKVYRRECIDGINFDESVSMAEGVQFIWNLFRNKKGLRVGYIDSKLYHYRDSKHSATQSISLDQSLKAVDIWSEIIGETKKINNGVSYKSLAVNYLVSAEQL